MMEICKERKNVIEKLLDGQTFYEESIKARVDGVDVEGCGIYKNDKLEVGGHRYYLYISLKQQKPENILTVIMFNPSKTFPGKGFDSTVKNVIKIALKAKVCEKEFDAVEVLNLFSLINGSKLNAKKSVKDVNAINEEFILEFLKSDDLNKNNTIMVAWGADYKNKTKDNYITNIRQLLKNKAYTFCKEKRDYPKHPGSQGGSIDCCIKHCHGENGVILKEYYF